MSLLLHVDGVAGISGDMTLGALVDLGVPLERLRDGLSSLPLPPWRLEARRILSGGLAATRVLVEIDAEPAAVTGDHGHDHGHVHGHDHGHDHDHGQAHDHDHPHVHPHSDGHVHGAQATGGEHHLHPAGTNAHGRSWSDLRRAIGDSALPPRVKDASLAVFRRLCEVEAEIHGVALDEVHLHEAGAADALIDICGACLGLDVLGWPEMSCSPPDLGCGSVRCAHGLLPVPSPATLRLLAGRPVMSSGLAVELTTPTGAALLSTLCTSWGAMPPMIVRASGFGAGTKTLPDRANVVRFTLGERAAPARAAQASPHGGHLVIEADLDDADPQLLAAFCDRARELGAADATLSPVVMKKGRAGTRLTILATEATREPLLEALFSETTTIGCRIVAAERAECERRIVEAPTAYGPIRCKLARWNGRLVNVKPEHDDCLQASRRAGVPLKDVVAAASASARQLLEPRP